MKYPDYRDRVQWWKAHTKGMGWFAVCETSLRSEKVDIEHVGHFVSIGFEPGIRTYAFASQKYRDRFVNKYRPFGARPCGDPTRG